MAKKVSIVGAGMAGLTAASHLAQQGHEVILFDRARYPGGAAGYYRYKNIAYPTGATISFGLESDGPLRRVLQSAGIVLEPQSVEQTMDVVLEDRTIHVYGERMAWRSELRSVFPERADAVLRFWDHLALIADIVYRISKSRASLPIRRIVDLGSLPAQILRDPLAFTKLFREQTWTVLDALRKYGLEDYAPFVRFLNAQLLDAAQVDVSLAAWLPASVALDIYRFGIYAVQGELGGLAQTVYDHLLQRGVTIKSLTTIVRVEQEHSQGAWRLLTSKNETFLVDAIINATGQPIPGGPEKSFFSKPTAQEPAWGAVRLDVTVLSSWLDNLDLPINHRKQPFAWQIANDAAIGDLVADPHGAVYVTSHPECYPLEMDGTLTQQVISISMHTPTDLWMTLPVDEYQAKKEAVRQAIIARVERFLPGFEKAIITQRLGTPKTYYRYLQKSVVGGTPLTVRTSLKQPIGARTKAKGYYIAGDAVFPGPGTLSAALSGYFAARAIDPQVVRW